VLLEWVASALPLASAPCVNTSDVSPQLYAILLLFFSFPLTSSLCALFVVL